jgi:hypothetical protein
MRMKVSSMLEAINAAILSRKRLNKSSIVEQKVLLHFLIIIG